MLNIFSSIMGIFVLAYINSKVLNFYNDYLVLLTFFLLVIIFLLSSIIAQFLLTRFGHHFVLRLQEYFLKRILDTENLKILELGKAKILASLNNDIKNISFGIMRLPEMLQGFLFAFCASIYIFSLHSLIFLIVFLWLFFAFLISHFIVKYVYHYLNLVRDNEDILQKDYQMVIEGHKELNLSIKRSQLFYEKEFKTHTKLKCINAIKADTLHNLANNLLNAMILALAGLIIYLSLSFSWIKLNEATMVVFIILFIRTPLISAIGALPMILSAKLSFDKINKLNLASYEKDFKEIKEDFSSWKSIELKNISFNYPNSSFALKNINFKINRGELVFCIGKNGSGKSTLSLILSGILRAYQGEMKLDNILLNEKNIHIYRKEIGVVFSEFFLFDKVICEEKEKNNLSYWLEILDLNHKVKVQNFTLSTTSLSQGQKKRLALFLTLMEDKKFLILDEFGADQDPLYRNFFYTKLLPLLQKQNYTIFAITHDDKYFYLADRVILMKEGNLKELNQKEIKELNSNIFDQI
ncbi:ATP-binding cassette domain-containing protein [Campylobacter sp. 2018MI34]|uniref:ATP-binding cassette domain-containing protein n=1 Tax=Campylobacter sp. 2018MI34 TaxID=2800582 RepID=UPI001903B658